MNTSLDVANSLIGHMNRYFPYYGVYNQQLDRTYPDYNFDQSHQFPKDKMEEILSCENEEINILACSLNDIRIKFNFPSFIMNNFYLKIHEEKINLLLESNIILIIGGCYINNISFIDNFIFTAIANLQIRTDENYILIPLMCTVMHTDFIIIDTYSCRSLEIYFNKKINLDIYDLQLISTGYKTESIYKNIPLCHERIICQSQIYQEEINISNNIYSSKYAFSSIVPYILIMIDDIDVRLKSLKLVLENTEPYVIDNDHIQDLGTYFNKNVYGIMFCRDLNDIFDPKNSTGYGINFSRIDTSVLIFEFDNQNVIKNNNKIKITINSIGYNVFKNEGVIYIF
jgi:hypothetical protein